MLTLVGLLFVAAVFLGFGVPGAVGGGAVGVVIGIAATVSAWYFLYRVHGMFAMRHARIAFAQHYAVTGDREGALLAAQYEIQRRMTGAERRPREAGARAFVTRVETIMRRLIAEEGRGAEEALLAAAVWNSRRMGLLENDPNFHHLAEVVVRGSLWRRVEEGDWLEVSFEARTHAADALSKGYLAATSADETGGRRAAQALASVFAEMAWRYLQEDPTRVGRGGLVDGEDADAFYPLAASFVVAHVNEMTEFTGVGDVAAEYEAFLFGIAFRDVQRAAQEIERRQY